MAVDNSSAHTLPRTPRGVRALADEIPHNDSVNCLCCGSSWNNGDQYVNEGLLVLRAEYKRVQADLIEGEHALRFALLWLARDTEQLLESEGFELSVTCPECNLIRAHSRGKQWAESSYPPQSD